MVLNLLVTSRCNMNCEMCEVGAFRRQAHQELSADELGHIVRQTLPFRPTFFFGGGEPFVRDDVLDLVVAVKKHGLPLGMISNGLAVTGEVGRDLKALGPEQMIFSLHGPEAVHARITRTTGTFERVIDNIELFCRSKGKTRVLLNVVLTGNNIDHIAEVVEIGARIGVDQVRIEHLEFITDPEIERHQEYCRVHLPENLRARMKLSSYIRGDTRFGDSPAEIARVLSALRRRYGSFLVLKPRLGDDEMRSWYTARHSMSRMCLFVWRSLFLDPAGNVIPCLNYMDTKLGNALREPLLEIWNGRSYRALRRAVRRSILPGCARCGRL